MTLLSHDAPGVVSRFLECHAQSPDGNNARPVGSLTPKNAGRSNSRSEGLCDPDCASEGRYSFLGQIIGSFRKSSAWKYRGLERRD